MNIAMIDRDAILAPIAGAEPSGEYLYYTPVYDEIRQARRRDDAAFAADGEGKEAEWGKVVSLCQAALAERSKDLLLAAWLTEALVIREGFPGLALGLSVLEGLVENYWESVFPLVEDDDYDGRAAPFEFLNEKISISVKQVPLTDPKRTPGYGLLRYRESRKVGYEGSAKPDALDAAQAEGKITADDFDGAMKKSEVAFYRSLSDAIGASLEQFKKLEAAVDAKFGPHAPGLSELAQTLEECQRLVLRICNEEKGLKDALEPGAQEAGPAPSEGQRDEVAQPSPTSPTGLTGQTSPTGQTASHLVLPVVALHADAQETQLWEEALRVMQDGGFKKALDLLLAAANSQPSERGRCRYRFLVAQLCLRAGRPELARPIVEQLNAMVTELQLEKWESPFWISEILEALYQCLTTCEDADEEASRAKELFKKICTLDVTKALK